VASLKVLGNASHVISLASSAQAQEMTNALLATLTRSYYMAFAFENQKNRIKGDFERIL